ncbi:MAG TPA: hypothetical protein VE967_00290 [Gemmatimonadaceae bacterium]|nr:hypothetical protein [Gemmatimonadaceae bacterium]
MARYVIRFTDNSGEPPPDDAARVRRAPSAKIIDDTGRMMLVDLDDDDARALTKSLPKWVVVRESTVPVPDPRKKLRDR